MNYEHPLPRVLGHKRVSDIMGVDITEFKGVAKLDPLILQSCPLKVTTLTLATQNMIFSVSLHLVLLPPYHAQH